MKKIFKLLGRIPSNLVSIIVAIVGFILIFGQKILNLILLWNMYNRSNSAPSNRPEKIGQPDKEGYEQVHTRPATDADMQHKPTGTDPEVIINISGHGKLNPVDKPTTNDDDGSTDALIRKLEEEIKNN